MRYVSARAEKFAKDRTYRIYVTECMKAIAENTARMVGGGKYLQTRFADLVDNSAAEETRTAEEIIAGIRSKITELR